MLEAASYILPRPTISEVTARISIGASAGFTLRYLGLLGRIVGRSARAASIAAWTSRAAPSISRFSSNCKVMPVDPSVLPEVISVTPAMRVNCRSSGAATEVAMVSGLAPGRYAETLIVGNSTSGRAATGIYRKANIPTSVMPTVNNVVATGRWMQVTEIFMPNSCQRLRDAPSRIGVFRSVAPIGRMRDRPPVSYREGGFGGGGVRG